MVSYHQVISVGCLLNRINIKNRLCLSTGGPRWFFDAYINTMFKITIIAVGKVKEKFWQEALKEYQKRLKPYVVLDMLEVKAESFGVHNRQSAQNKENQRLLAVLAKYDKQNIYLLAERGQEFDSIGFANFIKAKSELVLVIGGALGWAEEIKIKYTKSISLSQLTMPHEMARVVLLEQIYRAATIIQNKEYHY